MDNRTEVLAPGVWRVEVGYLTNAYLLADDGSGDSGGLTVVDTGNASGGPRLVRSIRMLGLDPRAVRRVLLTHWHRTHAGSAAAFARSSARPSIHAGAEDVELLAGTTPEGRRAADGGPTLRRAAEALGLLRPPAVVTAEPLTDGQVFEVAGGLRVLATPGHTPGHRSFWLPAQGVLIAGDAVWNVLAPSRGPRLLSTSPDTAATSLERLAALEPGVVAVGHGPPLRNGLREIAASR